MSRGDLQLFGKYIRRWNFETKKTIDKWQFVKPVPVKAYGRSPSIDSQKNLYHDEDYNHYTKVSRGTGTLGKVRRLLRPFTLKKDFYSDLLSYRFRRLKVTLSALEAMEKMGGFDEYILRTPPEELRSTFGEKTRKLMYYYMAHPEIKKFKLPATFMIQDWAQNDPWYARHFYLLRMARFRKALAKVEKKRSPYYLPSKQQLHPERQKFGPGIAPPKLKLWWKESPELEVAFRRRLGEAKMFERQQPAGPDGFIRGNSRGGGGPHGTTRVVKPRVIHNRLYGHGKYY